MDYIISQISFIYKKYSVPKNIQMHLFRTASVAEYILDALPNKRDKESIITALLLHDIGNIVKMSLGEKGITFLAKEDKTRVPELQKIKDEFIAKYGSDDILVSLAIAKEIGVSERVLFLLKYKSFKDACFISTSNDLELSICGYSDWRVGPFGVLSLDARIQEVKHRYKDKKLYQNVNSSDKKITSWLTCAKLVEKNIFALTKVTPLYVTDASIEKYLGKYTSL